MPTTNSSRIMTTKTITTTIERFCEQHGITLDQFHGREKYGGYLYLRSVTSLPEGFNPTVGGYLDLGSVTSLPEGFNPTVGGHLYWKGGHKHIGATVPRVPRPHVPVSFLSWKGGRYVKVDGIFSEVISQRGNVYHTRQIGSKDTGYLVTNGQGAWSHGDTLEAAREDLVYKVGKRSLEDFSKADLTSLDFTTAVGLYRTVTGACAAGVKQFVQQHNIDKAKIYTLEEMIKLTRGAYGHEALAAFAKNRQATHTPTLAH